MTQKSRFWEDGSPDLPVSPGVTPLEEALARARPKHQHEWPGEQLRLQHDHCHDGEYHEHAVDELLEEVLADNALLFEDEETS